MTSNDRGREAGGRAQPKRALYFGCLDAPGHYLYEGRSKVRHQPPECCWDIGLMDSGLLRNGRHPDVYDGKVWWTCGGISRPALWYAFFWWDRSVDRRGACNSGFYVGGFAPAVLCPETARENAVLAFQYACAAYPWVVSRQRQPLVLQGVPAPCVVAATIPSLSGDTGHPARVSEERGTDDENNEATAKHHEPGVDCPDFHGRDDHSRTDRSDQDAPVRAPALSSKDGTGGAA